jgi:hypothetical protein
MRYHINLLRRGTSTTRPAPAQGRFRHAVAFAAAAAPTVADRLTPAIDAC